MKLERTLAPEPGRVFFAMPYGTKPTRDGEMFDFDNLYEKVFVRAVHQRNMVEDRADHIFGTTVGVLDAVWTGIQRAEVVVVDFTSRSADVALEFAWAAVLGKRMVVLTQHREDLPVDIRGDIRPLIYSMDGVGGVELMEELKQQLQEARDQVKGAEKTLVTIDNDPSTALRPATVLTIDGDHAVVETEERGSRRFCVLSGDDVTYNRIYRDMSKFCRVGQRLNGAIVTDFNGGVRYSLLVNEDNPWPGILANYPEGTLFRTRVDNFRDGIGAFAEVAGKVNGLVLGSRDRGTDLGVGTEIEAEVFKVEPEIRQITLRLHTIYQAGSPLPVPLRNVQPATHAAPGGYPAVGTRLDGRVVKIVPEGERQGGYVLVKLDGPQHWPTAMLHCSKMTSDLRHDLNNGHVDLDEEISVEVVQVDPFRRRVSVKDLPDASDQAARDRAVGEAGLAAAA